MEKRKAKLKTHHLLRERVDASELALRDDDFLKLVDLVMEELLLRNQELLKRLDRSTNL